MPPVKPVPRPLGVLAYEIVHAGERIPVPADNAGGVVMREAETAGVLLQQGDGPAIFLRAGELAELLGAVRQAEAAVAAPPVET